MESTRSNALVLPHMSVGYNLARSLLRNDHDAEDVTHEAIVRAFRFFNGFSGDNPRAWLLTVVRNSAYTFLHQNRAGVQEYRRPRITRSGKLQECWVSGTSTARGRIRARTPHAAGRRHTSTSSALGPRES
jgi:RNA polymerase sigma factor (sigma-70 family)